MIEGRWRVVRADCVEAMAAMEPGSVDAIVTDPPYGIGFMGKDWDSAAALASTPPSATPDTPLGRFRPGKVPAAVAFEGREFQRWCETWAREALRVLKPGGYALVFGGTRTFHRLTCGLEDAGFEIRDCLMWLYGSGFPKSLDVAKGIDKQRYDAEAVRQVTAWIAAARDAAGLTNGEIDAAFGFNGMAGHWTTQGSQAAVPTLDQVPRLLGVLGVEVDGVPDDVRRLLLDLNGLAGQPGEAWFRREVVGEASVPVGHAFAGATYGGDSSSQTVAVTTPATPSAARWDGWGTALKPAWEPVIVARKPLAGTVAGNVLAHGTGALNVDACRIATGDALGGGAETATTADQKGHEGWTRPWMDDPDAREAHAGRVRENVERAEALGRWPANVVLAHAEGCVLTGTRTGAGGRALPGGASGGERRRGRVRACRGQGGLVERSMDGELVEVWECVEGCPVRMLDEQTGDPGRGTIYAGGGGIPKGATEYGAPLGFGDSGGASRFFYTAKTSRAERDAGLDGFAPKFAPTMGDGIGVVEHNEDDASLKRNVHPTVKPIDLMRWLVRLVTPPGGTVLDPFTGSGSTGCAALLEGFRFVGVEREAEYAAIAEARLAFWENERPDLDGKDVVRGERERRRAREAGQDALF